MSDLKEIEEKIVSSNLPIGKIIEHLIASIEDPSATNIIADIELIYDITKKYLNVHKGKEENEKKD